MIDEREWEESPIMFGDERLGSSEVPRVLKDEQGSRARLGRFVERNAGLDGVLEVSRWSDGICSIAVFFLFKIEGECPPAW